MRNRRFFRSLFVALLCVAFASGQESKFFSIKNNQRYPKPYETLAKLVHAKGHSQRVNHFCAVGYRGATEHDDSAWLYWKEGNALILWSPAAYPSYPLTLADSPRFLNLSKDVVATDDDLHNSTYLVTRKWVEGIQADCVAHGDQFIIQRKTSTKRR